MSTEARIRLGYVIHQFNDCKDDQVIAAVALGKGTAQLTYGDLRTLHQRLLEVEGRLERIISWHCQETAEGGMVGSYCTECGRLHECDTRRMALGTYRDDPDDSSDMTETGELP